MSRLSTTAQLIRALMKYEEIHSTAALAKATGLSERRIWQAKAELKQIAGCLKPSAGGVQPIAVQPIALHPATDCSRGEANCSETLQSVAGSPSRACATKESLRDTSYQEVKILTPTTVEVNAARARVGEDEVVPGLFVNCKTIRHAAFAISIDGVAMQCQGAGATVDDVKNFCIAHALQWAAEIDGGKRPDQVVPSKVANFLGASFMGAFRRGEVADVIKGKAMSGPAPGGKPYVSRAMAALRAIEAEEAAS